MEEYFLAKKKLFDEVKKDSFAIVNVDDKYGKRIIGDYKGKVVEYSYFDIVKSKYKDDKSSIKLNDVVLKYNLIGSFNAYNIMAIYKTLLELGFSKKKCVSMIRKVNPVIGRMEKVTKNIYIDFAHTPDALSKAIYELKGLCKGDLHVVFGCGGNRDKTKRSIMGSIASDGADYVYITNDNPRWENEMDIISDICSGIDNRRNLYINPDRKECIEYAILNMKKNDILLVAGKGHEDYMIIKDEKIYFSDRETILCIKNH
jgi:UDP-N-acetylmuramoyl-L-alanyl-D-glutamate--2,6-diaminopimelate ligase